MIVQDPPQGFRRYVVYSAEALNAVDRTRFMICTLGASMHYVSALRNAKRMARAHDDWILVSYPLESSEPSTGVLVYIHKDTNHSEVPYTPCLSQS